MKRALIGVMVASTILAGCGATATSGTTPNGTSASCSRTSGYSIDSRLPWGAPYSPRPVRVTGEPAGWVPTVQHGGRDLLLATQDNGGWWHLSAVHVESTVTTQEKHALKGLANVQGCLSGNMDLTLLSVHSIPLNTLLGVQLDDVARGTQLVMPAAAHPGQDLLVLFQHRSQAAVIQSLTSSPTVPWRWYAYPIHNPNKSTFLPLEQTWSDSYLDAYLFRVPSTLQPGWYTVSLAQSPNATLGLGPPDADFAFDVTK